MLIENLKTIITGTIIIDREIAEEEMEIIEELFGKETAEELLDYDLIINKSKEEIIKEVSQALEEITQIDIQRLIVKIMISIIKIDGKAALEEIKLLRLLREKYPNLNYDNLISMKLDRQSLIKELKKYI